MELGIKCAACGAGYRVPERLAGKTLKCKACGAPIKVPAAEPEEVELTDEDALDFGAIAALGAGEAVDTGDDEPVVALPGGFDAPKRRGGLNPLLIVGGVAAVLVVGGLTVAVGMMLSGGGSSTPTTANTTSSTDEPAEQNDSYRGLVTTRGEAVPKDLDPRLLAVLDEWPYEERVPTFMIDPQMNGHLPIEIAASRLKKHRDRLRVRRGELPPDHASGETPSTRTPSRPTTTASSSKPKTNPTRPSNIRPSRPAPTSVKPTKPGGSEASGELVDLGLEPIGSWDAKPDPRQGKAPKLPPELSIPIGPYASSDIQFPQSGGPFVLVGNNKDSKAERVLFDLRTGRPMGRFDGAFEFFGDRVSLAPDGKLMAGLVSLNGRAELHLVSLLQRRVAAKIPLGQALDSHAKVMFVGKTTLLVSTPAKDAVEADQEQKRRLRLYDAKTKAVLWELASIEGVSLSDARVSQGGAYIAIPMSQAQQSRVLFLSAETGERAGELAAPFEARSSAISLDFTPDGAQMIAAFRGSEKEGRYKEKALLWVTVWDMTTGKEKLVLRVPDGDRRTNSYSRRGPAYGRTVEWIGNGPFVALRSRSLMDTRNGKMILDLPGAKQATNSYAYGSQNKPQTHLLSEQFYEGRRLIVAPSTTRGMHVIQFDAMDTDGLLAAADLVERGIDPREVGLPEATVPPASPLAWLGSESSDADALLPDPAPEPVSKRLARPILINFKNPANTKRRTPRPGLVVNPAGSNRALIYNTEQDPEAPDPVFVFDLTRPGSPEAIELPGAQKPLAISPDGTKGLFVTGDRRLDLFELDKMTHVVGWHHAWASADAPITDALLATEDRLWVRTAKGHATLYSLPDLAVVGVEENWKTPVYRTTPGGRCVLMQTEAGIRLLDARTGHAVTDIVAGPGQLHSFGVAPDGKRVALSLYEHNVRYIEVHDLKTGEPISRIATPQMAGATRHVHPALRKNQPRLSIAWAGNEKLLLGDYLVDPTTGWAHWRYKGASQRLPRAAGGERTWTYHTRDTRVALRADKLPEPVVLKTVEGSLHSQMDIRALIGPETHVRLEISGIDNADEYTKKLKAHLKQYGLIEDPAAEYAFRISQSSTSRTEEYYVREVSRFSPRINSPFGPPAGTPTTSVTLRTITATGEWLDTEGNSMWKTSTSRSSHLGGSVDLKEGESLQAIADKTLGDLNFTALPPPVVMPNADDHLLGTSEITPDGVVTQRR